MLSVSIARLLALKDGSLAQGGHFKAFIIILGTMLTLAFGQSLNSKLACSCRRLVPSRRCARSPWGERAHSLELTRLNILKAIDIYIYIYIYCRTLLVLLLELAGG